MDWIIDPFELAFQQRALLGAGLAAIALAITGTWVILRGMTFLGDALVHGVIPGIALAVLLDFSVLVGAALAAVVMIGGINLIHRQTSFSEDTGIGLLFVGMLALGVILISRTPSFAGSLTTILFGDALGLSTGDVVTAAVVAAVVLVSSTILYRPFLVLAFNEQKAKLLGLRPAAAHTALLGLITVSIVGSSQAIGTLLVFGLLVGPPATAALLVRRVPVMMIVSAAIGLASVVIGLFVSFYADTSGSATMAITPVVIFFAVLALVGLRKRRPSARPAWPAGG